MLAAEGIVKKFGGLQVLTDVSLSVDRAQITGLIGPNGSGKTTLFNIISGLLPMDAGRIILSGETLDTSRPDRVAKHGVVRTFQLPRVAGRMTVLENLMLVPRGQIGESMGALFTPWVAGRVRGDQRRVFEASREMVAFLGLNMVANDLARTLSGGQLKLLSVGMALMAEPQLLLLDEPVAGVNPVIIERLCNLLIDKQRSGLTILIIEHNIEVMAQLCSRLFVLDAGRVIASGTPSEVRSNEAVIRAYLGLRRTHPN